MVSAGARKPYFSRSHTPWTRPTRDLPDHVLDFGEYNPVRTERVYFYTFDEVDCSRTRLVDDRHAAVCDRIVYFLKKEGCFIVNDIVIPQEDGSYTAGPVTTHNRLSRSATAAMPSARPRSAWDRSGRSRSRTT